MPSFFRTAGIVALLAITAAGCSDSNDPYDDDDNNNSLTASYDPEGATGATQFAATVVLGAKSGDNANSTMSLIATNAQGHRLTFSVTGNSTGTFQVGHLISGSSATLELGNPTWANTFAGATGQVVITTRTATYMTGSFAITLAPATGTGATGTMLISGTFTAYFGQT